MAATYALLIGALCLPGVARADAQREQVYAAVITIEPRDGESNGDYYCPPPESEDDICFGATLLIQRSQIERYIGSRPKSGDPWIKAAQRFDVDGAYFRLKLIGGHAMRRIPAGHYLAVLEPTDKDYIFVQWYERLDRRRTCFKKDLIEHYGARLTLPIGPPDKDGARCE